MHFDIIDSFCSWYNKLLFYSWNTLCGFVIHVSIQIIIDLLDVHPPTRNYRSVIKHPKYLIRCSFISHPLVIMKGVTPLNYFMLLVQFYIVSDYVLHVCIYSIWWIYWLLLGTYGCSFVANFYGRQGVLPNTCVFFYLLICMTPKVLNI